ncbi:MAG: Rv3235 family protein [Janthinobacterium lividum]
MPATAALLTDARPRLRLHPVPLAAPPLVGEPGAVTSVLTHLDPGQGVFALDLPQRRLPPPRELPEVSAWSRRYLVVLLEVLSGHRPPQQLLRWSATDIYSAVLRRSALQARLRARTGTLGHAPRVTSLRVCSPADGVVEVSAVVRDGDRVRAHALRVEGREGRWRVTALELG